MFCTFCQWTVHGNIITILKQLLKRYIADPLLILFRCPGIYKYVHIQSLCDLDNFPANVSCTYNTKCFSIYLNMRNLKISGKIVMISACQHLHLYLHCRTQIQYHHDRSMCHTFCAVCRDIADCNPLLSCCFKINIIISCACLTDQFDRFREVLYHFSTHRHLLCYNDISILNTF